LGYLPECFAKRLKKATESIHEAGFPFIDEGRMAMLVEKLVEHFSALEDPWCAGKVEHRLIDMLVIAVCAVIACAGSWDDIALHGRNKVGRLRSFLNP
jgi:hypothetical protein